MTGVVKTCTMLRMARGSRGAHSAWLSDRCCHIAEHAHKIAHIVSETPLRNALCICFIIAFRMCLGVCIVCKIATLCEALP